jgi:hypothetical protein
MHAFLVAEDFTVQTNRFARRYAGGTLTGAVPVERMVVDTGGEGMLVRRAMEQQLANTGKADDVVKIAEVSAGSDTDASDVPEVGPYVTGVTEMALLHWPFFPPRLGRLSSRIVGDGLYRHEEPESLSMQLAVLRARHPGKKHFRLAAVNAFGTNLGDCVLGMTAMRVVSRILEQYLGSFVVDMLLGAHSSAGNFDIVGHEPWIGQIRLTGPTLQEFANYDAYFDFTGLIGLPRFNEMPIVDWYLWWAGLDWEKVSAEDKRNRIYLRREAYEQIAAVLRPIPAPRILFNYKASVGLRCCPESAAVSLVERLLAADAELQIVLSAPLPFSHPRVHALHESMKAGTDRFNALVAQVDGVISVDTYSIHATDACHTPVVGLYASVPPDAYPYYPLHEGLLVPGGELLPAYRKSKVGDDEWLALQPQYEAAWHRLDAGKVLETLKTVRARRAQQPAPLLHFKNNPHRPGLVRLTPHGRQLRFDAAPPRWERAVARHIDMAKLLTKPGGTVVVVAPGQSQFSVALVEHIGPDGLVHIFEPRPQRRTLIAMDLLEFAPQTPVFWHETLPAKAKNIEVAIEEPLGETTPLLWGHSRVQRSIQAMSIDALELPLLSALFIFAPMPCRVAIQSALATLARTKAHVVCGPLERLDDVRDIAEMLQPVGYQCWVDHIEQRPDGAMLLIAVPDTIKVQAVGMKRVVLG